MRWRPVADARRQVGLVEQLADLAVRPVRVLPAVVVRVVVVVRMVVPVVAAASASAAGCSW